MSNGSETDFEIPQFLIHHYYISECISLSMNVFVLYLLIFRKGKLDSFRFYLLAFQILCSLCDLHLSFLMQLIPFFPYIVGGCANGLLLKLSLVTPHVCMTILSFLVGFQVNTLNICFLRKHQAIAQISGGRILPKYVYSSIVFLLMVYPFTFSVPFQLSGFSKEEQYKLIDEKYPQYRENFKKLANFEVYELNTMMSIFFAMIIIGCAQSTLTVSSLALQMYKGLLSCSARLSKSTLEKHKSSLKSLVGQFLTTPIAILPAMLIVLTIVFPFHGAQDCTRYMLMTMSTHSAINCLVVIFTFPEFRTFVMFWSRDGAHFRRVPRVSVVVSSGFARPVRNSWANSVS